MRKLLILSALVCLSLNSAIIRVCTTNPCGEPSAAPDYALTRAGIQSAITAAVCGDEIQIEATGSNIGLDQSLTIFTKSCPSNNRLRITTTKKSWLPNPGTRITPAYRPLIPMLRLTENTGQGGIPHIRIGATDAAAGNAYLTDGTGKGIEIVGVGFVAPDRNLNSTPSWGYIWAGGFAVCNPNFANNADLIFDRLLMTGEFTTGNNGGAIKVSANDVVISNSFFDDFRQWAEYQPTIQSQNGGTGYTITNNYFGSGATEVIHFGNDGPTCQAGLIYPSNILIEHNHLYKSLRWATGTPYYSGSPALMKNFIECKSCQNAVFRYNTGENSYFEHEGQRFAIALTSRIRNYIGGASAAEHPASAKTTNRVHANVDAPRTTVTLTCASPPCSYAPTGGATYDPNWVIGGCVALATVADPIDGYTGWENRAITNVSNSWPASVALTVSPAFSTSALTDRRWSAIACWNRVQDIQIYGNYWKNAAVDLSFHPYDTMYAGGGFGGNVRYYNNISFAPGQYFGLNGTPNWLMTPLYFSTVTALSPVQNVHFTHNTSMISTSSTAAHEPPEDRDPLGNLLFQGGVYPSYETGAQWGPLSIENNLFGPSVQGPSMSAAQMDLTTPNAATSRSQYNSGPAKAGAQGSFGPCTGERRCVNPTALFTSSFVNPFRNRSTNDFRILPSSIYFKAGSDGANLGADPDQVPTITLTIIPSWKSALAVYRLSGIISPYPCSAEVSTSVNLRTDAGTYTPINAVNPTFYIRSDSDAVNVRATGSGTAYRSFQWGDDSSALGDDGSSHDLALTPSTTYYYRLHCSGAVERGSFTTLADSGASTITLPVTVVPTFPNTTHVRIAYGPMIGDLPDTGHVSCSPSCTINLPTISRGRQLLMQIQETDGTNVLRFGPLRARMIP